MIAVGSAIRMLGGGLHIYGFTIFFLPLSRDLGLSRAVTSLAFSLSRAQGAIEGPLAGYLIDRFGSRPIMLTAVIMSGVGYLLLSGVHSYLSFLVVYLGIITVSFTPGFMHAPMVLANTWFIRRRAITMTLISASVGLGGTLIAPLLSMSVHSWGWRWGALLAGLSFLIVGTPLASLVHRSPESMGLLPDGGLPYGSRDTDPSGITHSVRQTEEVVFTVTQAMRTSTFWMFVLATLIRVGGYSTIMVHFIPIMVWKGMTEEHAAVILSIFAFLTFPAHLLVGWLADFVNKPRLMALSMLASTTALLVLTYGQGEPSIWIFITLFTVIESIFPVTWASVGDFFGRKYFATIRGTMTFFYMWGSVAGPVVAGAVYDRTQSYAPMLAALVVLFLLATVIYALVKRPSA